MNMQHFPRTSLAAKLPPFQAPPAPVFLVGLLLVCAVSITLLPLTMGIALLAAGAITIAVLI